MVMNKGKRVFTYFRAWIITAAAINIMGRVYSRWLTLGWAWFFVWGNE
ncbi:hypothetical protein bcgnr5379_60050 [Bacillus cereus]